jgi:hypothetical protein
MKFIPDAKSSVAITLRTSGSIFCSEKKNNNKKLENKKYKI